MGGKGICLEARLKSHGGAFSFFHDVSGVLRPSGSFDAPNVHTTATGDLRRNRSFRMTSPVLDLLEAPQLTRICAPMVRYSKQAFRELVRLYDVDIAYTPMILADSFTKSAKAR